jgi:lipoprotein-anchoring transpeptidase ErfK/SrfK
MNKMKLFSIVVSCLMIMSCGGSSSDSNQSNEDVAIDEVADVVESINSDTASTEDMEAVIPDTAKTIDEKKKVKEYDKNSFASAEDAIAFMENSGHWDKYSQGILPQMTGESLKYAQKLINSPYERFIVVDKERMLVILYDKYGRVEKEYKMACAKNYGTKQGEWDSRTPEGFFSAQGVYDSTDWLFKDKNGKVSQKRGQYGPRFIRLKNGKGVGIHGTCSPGALGRRVSHGCIRIHNDNILELVEYVEKGMPIIVSPSKRDARVNKNAGIEVDKISTKIKSGNKEEQTESKADSTKSTVKSDSTTVAKPAKKDTITNNVSAEKVEEKKESKVDSLKK